MAPHRVPRSRQLALLTLGAAIVAGCTVTKTRRPGSDMVITRKRFNPVEAIARTQCRQTTPAGPPVTDSLTKRQGCAVVIEDSVARGPVQQIQPPQRVP
jgi:hypothetical protein